jgi:23S rRNA (cytosine1962-C5)-methyltransferase
MKGRSSVFVSNGHVLPLANGSPWVFKSSIDMKRSRLDGSDAVANVFDPRSRFLFAGLLSADDQIVVRKIVGLGENDVLSREFVWEKLEFASRLRKSLTNCTAFRLLNSEGDGVGGVTIDVFDTLATMQMATAAARIALGEHVLDFLKTRFDNIVEISETKVRRLAHGQSSIATFMENNARFTVDVMSAQKTGAFLDQRENRKLVQSLSSQSRVLVKRKN